MKLYFIKPKDQVRVSAKNCPLEKLKYKKILRILFPESVSHLLLKSTCHFHKNKFNMFHHTLFCYLSRCPYFKEMQRAYKKYKIKN